MPPPCPGRTCLLLPWARGEPGELPRTFFSWQSGDSGMKLMLISSTSELLEPAEVTLSESVVSPLHRYCPHLSWSKDLEWELPLAQGSALGGCRLSEKREALDDHAGVSSSQGTQSARYPTTQVQILWLKEETSVGGETPGLAGFQPAPLHSAIASPHTAAPMPPDVTCRPRLF